jgi:hypothetical protein
MVSASALGLPTPVGTDPDDVAGYLAGVSTAITLLLGSRGAGTPTVTSAPASPPRTYLDTSTSPWGVWASDGNTWTQVNPVPGISGVTGLQAALQALSNALAAQAAQESSDVSALNGAITAQTTTERNRATAAEALLQPLSGKDTNGGYVGIDAAGDVHAPHDLYVGHGMDVHGLLSVYADQMLQQYIGDGTRRSVRQEWRAKRASDAASLRFTFYADADGEVVGSNPDQAAFDLWAYPVSAAGQMQFLRMMSVRIDQAYTPGSTSAYVEFPWPLRENGQRVYSANNPDPAVATEVTQRQNADTTLTNNLNTEATNRQNADSALTGRLNGHEAAWTTFVPRVTTDGGDVQPSSNGQMTGRYKVIGKTCHILVALVHGTDGTTGNGGQGTWIIQLPAGLTARAPGIAVFPVRIFSTNVSGAHVIGVGLLNSPTSIAVLVTSGSGSSLQTTFVRNSDASGNPALGIPQPGNSNFWWGSSGGGATGELYLSGTFELA